MAVLTYIAASFLVLDLTSGIASSITSGLTTCHLASCVVAILSNPKTTSVRSTRMLKTTEKRMMKLGFHVLLRSTFPNSCLAIPGTIALQDRVYHSIALFLLEDNEQHSFLVANVFVARPMRSSLLSYLGLLYEGGASTSDT